MPLTADEPSAGSSSASLSPRADGGVEAGLWFTVVDAVPVDDSLVARARAGFEATYGAWGGG